MWPGTGTYPGTTTYPGSAQVDITITVGPTTEQWAIAATTEQWTVDPSRISRGN